MPVADDPDVAVLEDRGRPVLVDGHNGPGRPDPDHVVELPAQPDGDVEPRRNGAARDADLAGARRPAPVGHLAGGGELGPQGGGERAQRFVLVRRHARPHADDDRGPGQRLHVVVAVLRQHADAAPEADRPRQDRHVMGRPALRCRAAPRGGR